MVVVAGRRASAGAGTSRTSDRRRGGEGRRVEGRWRRRARCVARLTRLLAHPATDTRTLAHAYTRTHSHSHACARTQPQTHALTHMHARAQQRTHARTDRCTLLLALAFLVGGSIDALHSLPASESPWGTHLPPLSNGTPTCRQGGAMGHHLPRGHGSPPAMKPWGTHLPRFTHLPPRVAMGHSPAVDTCHGALPWGRGTHLTSPPLTPSPRYALAPLFLLGG